MRNLRVREISLVRVSIVQKISKISVWVQITSYANIKKTRF